MAKRFAVFISIILTILTLGHYLILVTAKFLWWPACGGSWWQMVLMSAIMPAMFVLSMVLAFRYYNWFSKLIYTFTLIWIGLFIYLFFGAALFWIIYDLGGYHFSAWLGWTLMSVAVGISVYGILNANFTRITKTEVKLLNLPSNWEGKQILFLSDTHFGQIRNLNFANKLSKMISELKPEVLLIGGDMFDGGKAPAHDLAEIFKTIQTKYGTYFITGNHEEFTASRDNVDALKPAGIKVLDDEMVNLDGLQIAGVDYLKSASEEGFVESLKSIKLDLNLPSILIKHVPNRLNIPEEFGFSLQLSGHTHRGQMFPGRLFTKRIFKGHDYGLTQYKRMQVLTSSGAGTWGPPMRVATVSEIVLITLRKS